MKKLKLGFFITNAVLAVLGGVFLLICLHLCGGLESQKAAERWRGENELPFGQISCFMSSGDTLNLGQIYSFRRAMQNALTEASFTGPENGTIFVDAWNAFGRLNVAGEHGNGEAEAVAVGGNYFFFHPLTLVSGSYLMEDDVMDDRVVIDRELAWRLFGGDDLAGLDVTIGGMPFRIAGVVDRNRDFASRKADNGAMRIYLSYSAYRRMNGDSEPPITCYEVTMPQPVAGFAENIVKTNFPLGGGEMVNNTDRFTLEEIFNVLKEFGTRSMHLNSVIYPEWENAARCLVDWCALFLALAIFCAACPVVALFFTFLVTLIRIKDYLSVKVPAFVSDRVERSRQRRWDRMQRKKAGENADRRGE